MLSTVAASSSVSAQTYEMSGEIFCGIELLAFGSCHLKVLAFPQKTSLGRKGLMVDIAVFSVEMDNEPLRAGATYLRSGVESETTSTALFARVPAFSSAAAAAIAASRFFRLVLAGWVTERTRTSQRCRLG